jgi:hypothetical protein
MRGVAVVFVVACGGGASEPDASTRKFDAPPPPPPNTELCFATPMEASCIGNVAKVRTQYFPMGSTNNCSKADSFSTSTCTQGCRIEATYPPNRSFGSLSALNGKQALLCSENDATIGTPCDDAIACDATRAAVASDGTVTQIYLKCGAEKTCEPATPPPTWTASLAACDAATKTQYGVADVNGAKALTDRTACLLAWDATTSTAATAVTKYCIFDSQCPSNAMCDTEIASIADNFTGGFGVCKPGPRGVLSPAMLVP